jgi:hypothetical protein
VTAAPPAADAVPRALEELGRALDANDPGAAAACADRLAAAVREAEAAGVRLTAATLAAARDAHRRCEQTVSRLTDSLRASLLQSSASRRAMTSYRPEE